MVLNKATATAVAPSLPSATPVESTAGGSAAATKCDAFADYARLILPLLVTTCIIELLVQQPVWFDSVFRVSLWLPHGSFRWAVLDEAAHGIATSCMWGCIAQKYRQRVHSHSSMLWVYSVAFCVGVGIDIDHYVWGALLFGDASVHRARNLGAVRPLPHCVPIMLVCAIFAAAAAHRLSRRLGVSHGVPLRKASRGWLLLFIAAWSLHLLRDGIHRGVWLFPTSTALSTGLVPAPVYLAAAAAAPFVMMRFLPSASKAKAARRPSASP